MLDRDQDEVGGPHARCPVRVHDLGGERVAVDGQAGGAQPFGAVATGDEPGVHPRPGEVCCIHGPHGPGPHDGHRPDRSLGHRGSLATRTGAVRVRPAPVPSAPGEADRSGVSCTREGRARENAVGGGRRTHRGRQGSENETPS
ncbi:hypothetical protein SDC9_144519 [bioreactor metagenome]|uniref:Uncharacterized protein n=1 Tax=bioreactor metagenome TaxID=1076179 RepID=A0A645E705_9ZZZZ